MTRPDPDHHLSGLKPLRILITEDEFLIALDLEMQVRGFGYDVVGVAVSADEAISMARQFEPDVALMDLNLAGKTSGIEAAATIRSEFGITSIIVSGNVSDLSADDEARIAPVAKLAKPVPPARLRDVLAGIERTHH